VLNATLAGGVAIGSSCNMVAQAYWPLLIGSFAGLVSVLGFSHISPSLKSKLGLHDTCGVLDLHGLFLLLVCLFIKQSF
jgi:ammonium transporter Rh